MKSEYENRKGVGKASTPLLKIEFIKSPTGSPHFLAYSIGEIISVTKETGDKYEKDGIARYV